jgi:SAM-dependent methyltransferase
MDKTDIQEQWEAAAPGWAKWEKTFARWMEPATDAMLEMADLSAGADVLDLASGAGTQAILAARRVGATGTVVASDISENMLGYVREQARGAGLDNVSTLYGAAEDLDVPAESFDAIICRLGLMLFTRPAAALENGWRALRPGGRVSVVVFTTPAANAFMTKPMQVLRRHAAMGQPEPGQPGIFALGSPGVLSELMASSGLEAVEERPVSVELRMSSVAEVLEMMQDAFGAYRAVLSDQPEAVRKAAWAEVAEMLTDFESDQGFVAPGEVLVAAGTKPS